MNRESCCAGEDASEQPVTQKLAQHGAEPETPNTSTPVVPLEELLPLLTEGRWKDARTCIPGVLPALLSTLLLYR